MNGNFHNLKTTLSLLSLQWRGEFNPRKSSATPAKGASIDWKEFAANVTLAVSGPLFATLLCILLAIVVN